MGKLGAKRRLHGPFYGVLWVCRYDLSRLGILTSFGSSSIVLLVWGWLSAVSDGGSVRAFLAEGLKNESKVRFLGANAIAELFVLVLLNHRVCLPVLCVQRYVILRFLSVYSWHHPASTYATGPWSICLGTCACQCWLIDLRSWKAF